MHQRTVLPLAAVVLAVAGTMYGLFGQADFTADAAETAAVSPPTGSAGSPGTVASLLPRLEQRLAQQPDDADGWLLLARSYDHLGHVDKAAAAYARAVALGASDVHLDAKLVQNMPVEGTGQ